MGSGVTPFRVHQVLRQTGEFYFLETAARVGGAYIAEVVEFATGLNPWVEWARLNVQRCALVRSTSCRQLKERLRAGSVISLAKQEHPGPEFVYRP